MFALPPPAANPAAALVVLGAIVSAFRRSSPIGGWLFFFLWGTFMGCCTTALSLVNGDFYVLPNHWKNQSRYLMHLLSICPRLGALYLVAAISIALIRHREWRWIQMLQTGLTACLISQIATILIDWFVFPSALGGAVAGLFYPIAFLLYLQFSNRVVSVFKKHDGGTAN